MNDFIYYYHGIWSSVIFWTMRRLNYNSGSGCWRNSEWSYVDEVTNTRIGSTNCDVRERCVMIFGNKTLESDVFWYGFRYNFLSVFRVFIHMRTKFPYDWSFQSITLITHMHIFIGGLNLKTEYSLIIFITCLCKWIKNRVEFSLYKQRYVCK